MWMLAIFVVLLARIAMAISEIRQWHCLNFSFDN